MLSVQWAPDNGSGSPGSYTTLTSTAIYTGATYVLGAQIWLPIPPLPSFATGIPRFYQAYYTAANTITCTLDADLMMNPPDVKSVTSLGSNFSSAY
jgi:hypothetical protein